MPTIRPRPVRTGARRRAAGALAVLAAAALLAGCNSPGGSGKKKSFKDRVYETVRSSVTDSYHDPEADAKMARAEELFAAENYADAQKIYGDLADNTYNPTGMTEKARFKEAECVRLRGRLPAAVDVYNRLLQDFPAGLYSEQAAVKMYAVAEHWMKDSLGEIEEREQGRARVRLVPSLPNFTDKSKPAIDQEGELLKTLENITVGAPNSTVADKAMFWCGFLHFSHGRFEEADHFFSTLVDMYKDSPLRQEAARYAVMAKNNATGGAVYDGQKSAEALQLVHNLEATEPQYVQDKEKAAWLTRQKFAIRIQQAEKDYETAEYYRRTDHPGSAYFYYELVMRRYPGTKFSDLAKARIEEMERIKAQREADKAAGKVSTREQLAEGWGKLVGAVKPKADDGAPVKESAGPKDKPPTIVPQGYDGK